MREFIVREVGRLLRTDEFAHDFVGEAERMLRGIRGMLPARDASEPQVGALVVAERAPLDDSRKVIGILKHASGGYEVYGHPVHPDRMRPLTQEDADRMLDMLDESDLSWDDAETEEQT